MNCPGQEGIEDLFRRTDAAGQVDEMGEIY